MQKVTVTDHGGKHERQWSTYIQAFGATGYFSTPEAAIRSLCYDNGCTNIRIVEDAPIDYQKIELQVMASIARDCLSNMIERAMESRECDELVRFGKAQLDGDFDPLFSDLLNEAIAKAHQARR